MGCYCDTGVCGDFHHNPKGKKDERWPIVKSVYKGQRERETYKIFIQNTQGWYINTYVFNIRIQILKVN